MCYTCPFSLCKGCTKDSGYLSVRGNKGFCTTCMKVIMLIENKEQTDKETVCIFIKSFSFPSFFLGGRLDIFSSSGSTFSLLAILPLVFVNIEKR